MNEVSTSNTVLRSIDLTTNPSNASALLVISSNTLPYGIYAITYSATLTVTNPSSAHASSLTVYVSVQPTGIVVKGLANGVQTTSIGTNQQFSIEPSVNSYDLDGLVTGSSLNYRFYCRPVDSGVYGSYANSTYLDLKTQKEGSYAYSQGCFNASTQYQFNSAGSLVINAGGLAYVANRNYEFLIQTTYQSQVFSQYVTLGVQNVAILPIFTLYCHSPLACYPLAQYQRFSPDKQMIIDSECLQGCGQALTYSFKVYKNDGNITNPSWTNVTSSASTHLSGATSTSLTMQSSLFTTNSLIDLWKVEFQATTSSGLSGSSSILFIRNKLPTSGSCSVDLTTGVAMNTTFTVTCTGWTDPDGTVVTYEFYATYAGLSSPFALTYNSKGVASFQLPQGPSGNGYKLDLYVQVVDDADGITRSNISSQVTVNQNSAYTDTMMDDVLSGNPNATIFQTLSGGNLAICGGVVTSFAAMLNEQASSATATTTTTPATNTTSNSSTVDPATRRRSEVRDSLMNTISKIVPSDMSSAKVLASMISTITGKPNEVSLAAASQAVDKAVDLLAVVKQNAGKVPLSDIMVSAYGMIDAASNSMTSISSKIFRTIPNLPSDLNSTSGNLVDAQRTQIVDAYRKSTENVLSSLKSIVADYLAVNQQSVVNTTTMSVTFSKKTAQDLTNSLSVDAGQFNTPLSFCQMYQQATGLSNCTNETVITLQSSSKKVPTAGLNGDTESRVGNSAQIGLEYSDANNNKIGIKNLQTPITFTVTKDSSISTTNDLTFKQINTTSNISYTSNQMRTYLFPLSGTDVALMLQLKPSNLALKIPYLMFLQFGSAPVYNSTSSSFQYARLFCYSELMTDRNDQFYQLFLNMDQVNAFKGQVGIGIRPLTTQEKTIYCPADANMNNTKFLTNPPLLTDPTQITFNETLSIRMIATGCYHFDNTTGKWKRDGVEVLEAGTNTYNTVCTTTHLTEFAGGFVVLPEPIDFSYVFANASFDKNPLIYATVIGVTSLYILLAIWCIYMDRKDKTKTGICVLSDNSGLDLNAASTYFYEMIVYTGTRKDAGTDSNVKFVLSGEKGETDIRCLSNNDSERKILRRGGVDSFIMGTNRPLGDLTYLRVWHDNSGRGGMASWFLKCVIVHDLQTRENFYFICQQWLAVEKDDGLIDRLLPVSCDKQKTEFKYLLQKQAKNSLSDGHLWFSVLARPVQSSFTRLDRLTCCVVLLYLSMLMNILYYGIRDSPTPNALKIGPLSLTPEQIGIGIISNLIIFPPSFLLLQLFRRSRKRVTKSSRLRKILAKLESNPKTQTQSFTNINVGTPREDLFVSKSNPDLQNSVKPKEKVKKPLTFPWWCKIIAYCLAFIFSGISIFFIIVQGITFGNETVSRWLTSLVVSIATSIFLTQPIQIALVAFFFVAIFRKHDDKADLENDNDDDGKPINSKYKYIKRAGDEEYSSSTSLLRKHGYDKLDEEELEEARINRIKEVKIWKLIREIVMYSMFIWVLGIVSYANRDINSFNYQQVIRNILSAESPSGLTFDDINEPKDFWSWTTDILVPALKSSSAYYNDAPTNLNSYFADYSSYIISYPLMRQVRVENNSCALLPSVQRTIDFCHSELGLFNQEESNFHYSWTPYSSSYVETDPLLTNIYPAFQYTHSGDIQSYPYSGVYTTYEGAGYVYKMIGTNDTIFSDLKQLQKHNWVDRQTRAVFIEFSLFNPSINLFAYVNVLFEFLPSGVILHQIRASPMNLFQFNNSFTSLTIACNVIYLGFVIFFMFREIKELIKLKGAYFKRFWSYIEWLIIAFSWAAFAMYLYRLYSAEKISNLMKSYNEATTKTEVFIRLQLASYWDEALGYCLAFCAALGSMKFLKLLRFNKRIAVFIEAMKLMTVELLGFLFMFMIFYLAFVQLLYLTLNTETVNFSTMVKSMETCFQIMLGKFNVQPVVQANVVLGPLYFSFFNIMMVFILLNIFLTIVNGAFAQIRAEFNDKKDELDVVGYLYRELKNLLPFTDNQVEDGRSQQDRENAKYKDNISYFPQKVDDLLNLLSQIYRQETKH